MLRELLERERAAILERWVALILDTYPPDTARFLRREGDQFLNPVGHAISHEAEAILQELSAGADPERLSRCLDGIVGIRAVQEFSPSEAVGFVFLLKRAARDVVKEGGKGSARNAELLQALDAATDDLALLAFDSYMFRRERLFEIRANEARRRSERLLERINRMPKAPDDGDDAEQEPDSGSSDLKRGNGR